MTPGLDRVTAKLLALSVVLAGLSAAALGLVDPAAEPLLGSGLSTVGLGVAASAAFVLGEMLLVRMRFRSEAHDFNLTDIPLTIGLFLLTPGTLAIAAVIAVLVVRVVRRQDPLKALVNLSLSALETTTAVLVFRTALTATQALPLDAGTPLHPQHWLAATLALVVANTVSAAVVGLLISIAEGRSSIMPMFGALPLTAVMTVANTTVTLACITQYAVSFWSGLFMFGPLLVLFTAYHAYVGQREEAARMATIANLTTTMATATPGPASVEAVLGIISTELGADRVVLLLNGCTPTGQSFAALSGHVDGGPSAVTVVLVDADGLSIQRVDGLDIEQLHACAPPDGDATIVNAPLDGAIGLALAELDVEDALIAPMRSDAGLTGLLVVANRQGEVTRWLPQDRELAAALAAQMSTLLRSSLLTSALRSAAADRAGLLAQSRIDELTGLHNRKAVRDLADGAQIGGVDTPVTAVIYMDLDDFKQVNDVHGHAVGDALLRTVGQRLSGLLRTTDIGLRLGGDEFAVLVRQPIDQDALRHLIGRVRDVLSEPSALDGVTITPDVSLGFARLEPGEDLMAAMHRADIAMYADKRRRTASRRGARARLQLELDVARSTPTVHR